MTNGYRELREKVSHYKFMYWNAIRFTSLILSYLQVVTLVVFTKQVFSDVQMNNPPDTRFVHYVVLYLASKCFFLFFNENLFSMFLCFTNSIVYLLSSKYYKGLVETYYHVFYIDWFTSMFTFLLWNFYRRSPSYKNSLW